LRDDSLRRGFQARRATLGAIRVTSDIEDSMTVHPEREIPLSPSTDGMLASLIQRVVDGRAEPIEVTSVLRRVCDESRHRPPELLVLRVKELWTKVAGAPWLGRDEKDRRYFGFVGEALVLYFGSAPSDFVARRPAPLHDDAFDEHPASRVL
jgi:hypothetical protein